MPTHEVSPEPGLRVLVVDDDPFQLRIAERILRGLGIEAITLASEARAAIDELSQKRSGIDVLLCDLDMPDLDGLQFLRLAASLLNSVSVILTSAHDERLIQSAANIARSQGLNVLGILKKPLRPGILDALLSAHIIRLKSAASGALHTATPKMSEAEIAGALSTQQFEPFFQPKINLADRKVVGAELLARWRHPTRGIIHPIAFIATLEASGGIDRLTELLLEKAAAFTRAWREAGTPIKLAVNLSGAMLRDEGLSARLLDFVRANGLTPQDLTWEVTESVAITDAPIAYETLVRLRMKGFGLSIDDFGTGYSSMEQLAKLPFTELKVDRQFVAGAAERPDHRALLESSLKIARDLNLLSVAEGVESEEEARLLASLGCDIAQGYLFAKPMAGPELLPWIREREGQ